MVIRGYPLHFLSLSLQKKPEKVNVTLASDNVYARSEIKDGSKYITSASLSPKGERMVVTARGEVFNIPVDKGVTKNITRTPGAHERDAQWSPDGKHIAYISDATGETELYLQDSEGGEPIQLTKNNDTYIRTFQWSPDSKKIVYTDRKNRINLLDVSNKQLTNISQSLLGEARNVSFSPDNNWLTYSRVSDNNFSIVYVYDIAGKKEYPVTDKWYESYSVRMANIWYSLPPVISILRIAKRNGIMCIIIWVAYIWRYCLRIPLPRLWKRMRR